VSLFGYLHEPGSWTNVAVSHISEQNSNFNPRLYNVVNRSINYFYSGFDNQNLETALLCQMLLGNVYYACYFPNRWPMPLSVVTIYFAIMAWDYNVNYFVSTTKP
jgi:hypothetical protein